MARKLATAAGLEPHQCIVGRADYEALLSRVTALRAAVADLDRVRPALDDPVDLVQCLEWLLSYAREV